MRALHRMVVAGAVGGLATAAFAASGAFACTELAWIRLSAPGPAATSEADVAPTVVQPGDKLDVHFGDFYPAAQSFGDVKIKFLDAFGRETPITQHPGPSTPERGRQGLLIAVPLTAPSSEKVQWFVAEQLNSAGEEVAERPWGIYVWNGSATPTPVNAPTPPPPEDPNNPPAATDPGSTPAPPEPGASPSTPNPAPQNGPRPGSPRAGTPTAPAAPSTAGAPAPAVLPGQAGERPVDPLLGVPGSESGTQAGVPLPDDLGGGNQPQLAPNDLWSGVERGSSLVDPPLPPSGGGASPAGVILLAAGVLALAGVAASPARRRLAAVRAAR